MRDIVANALKSMPHHGSGKTLAVPKDAIAYDRILVEANRLASEGDYLKASKRFQKAIKSAPPAAYHRLGHAHLQSGNLVRAAVELAKDWRTDRALRRLEALLAVADKTASLVITGNGDVIEPEKGIMAIGSGGPFAQSAALALLDNTDMSARDIVEKSLGIAADICIYTNHNRTIEVIEY